jgi:hypothetical protein
MSVVSNGNDKKREKNQAITYSIQHISLQNSFCEDLTCKHNGGQTFEKRVISYISNNNGIYTNRVLSN